MYTISAGKIYEDGQEIQLRGVSAFGFNADILIPQFLWAMGWKAQIAHIRTLGFNAVRVPFVPATLYFPVAGYSDARLNPELIGRTPLQVLDLWMAEADRLGLYVLLDFHSVTNRRLYPTWFVSNPADFPLTHDGNEYTQADWIRDLVFVANRYAHLSHFFALDLYNEPHGRVRWSAGDRNMTDPAYYWKPAAEAAAAAVLSANPNLLVFAQGIQGNWDGRDNSSIPMNFGESFQPQAYDPLDIPADKLVLSPHTYGPDVFGKSTFGAATFPANLQADWETLFGRFHGANAVVLGEWGGRYRPGSADEAWQDALVEYLVSKGMGSSFYWCYTPNSDDTGGILDDDLNPREDKMALLRRLWEATAPSEPVLQPIPPIVTDKTDRIIELLTEIAANTRES
jgi:aryl-phospho-beta-D-glucosidase BglC (GH1 family)